MIDCGHTYIGKNRKRVYGNFQIPKQSGVNLVEIKRGQTVVQEDVSGVPTSMWIQRLRGGHHQGSTMMMMMI